MEVNYRRRSIAIIIFFALISIHFAFAVSDTSQQCKAWLVQSIPTDMPHLRRVSGVLATADVFQWLAGNSSRRLDIIAQYWQLRAHPEDPRSGDYGYSKRDMKKFGAQEGSKVYSAIENAADRNVSIRLLSHSGVYPDYTTEPSNLASRRPTVKNVTLLLGDWWGSGIVHAKVWISDRRDVYIGSANNDWKSLTQVKELGIYLVGCPKIAKKVEAYFDNLWTLASLNSSEYTNTVSDQQWQIERKVPCWSRFIDTDLRCRYCNGWGLVIDSIPFEPCQNRHGPIMYRPDIRVPLLHPSSPSLAISQATIPIEADPSYTPIFYLRTRSYVLLSVLLGSPIPRFEDIPYVLGYPILASPKVFKLPIQTPGRDYPLEPQVSYLSFAPPELSFSRYQPDEQAWLDTIKSVGYGSSLRISAMDWLGQSQYTKQTVYWSSLSSAISEVVFGKHAKVKILVAYWAHFINNTDEYLKSLLYSNVLCSSSKYNKCSGKVEIKYYMVPGYNMTGPAKHHKAKTGNIYPDFTRVNHGKYAVSDVRANIGTSNLIWDYFYTTAGVSFGTYNPAIVSQLQEIFDADWNSPYAVPVGELADGRSCTS